MNTEVNGVPEQPGSIVVADPPAGSSFPKTVTAYAAYLAVTGKNLRKDLTKKIAAGEQSSRSPNAVKAEVDVEALLNERFLADALTELRGRPGILASGDDPLTFEVVLEPTIRTEAEGLYDLVKAEIDNLDDPHKQVLVLSAEPILITEDDKKPRKGYHLVRLAKVRSHTERIGIPLELPKPAVPQPAPIPATEEAE